MLLSHHALRTQSATAGRIASETKYKITLRGQAEKAAFHPRKGMIKGKFMKKTFICTSNVPGTEDFTAMMFELESDKANSPAELKTLARKAAKQYAMTDEGCAAYNNKGEFFNWWDLIDSIDNKTFKSICDKLHLRITWLGTSASDDLWVNRDESLMENFSVDIAKIKWATDGEDVSELPTEVTLDIDDPNTDIADTLSDEYGFLVETYSVEEVF